MEPGPELGDLVDDRVVDVRVGGVEGEQLARHLGVHLGPAALEEVPALGWLVAEQRAEVAHGVLGRDGRRDAGVGQNVAFMGDGALAADGVLEQLEDVGAEPVELCGEAVARGPPPVHARGRSRGGERRR